MKTNKYAIRLRRARKSADLTLAELASITGLTITKIHKYEKAQVIPKIDVYDRIMDACATINAALDLKAQ